MVQHLPKPGSLFPTLLLCGRSRGQGGKKGGDLGGGGGHGKGVAWPPRQPISLSNMWSVAMAMPFDVTSGRSWERWQR